jgi:hypothetical protein
MASQEDDRYEELRRRIGRVEVLASLAFVGSAGDIDEEARYFISRYIRDFGRRDLFSQRRISSLDSEFDYLLDRLLRANSLRLENLENEFNIFQSRQSELFQNLAGKTEDVRSKIYEVTLSVEKLKRDSNNLSADTHEWLAIQSLGLEASGVKISRFIPLRVYLSDTPGQAIDAVSDSLAKFLEAFEFGISDDFPAIQGSWFKKWFAKTVEAATQPEVLERLKKIERAVELNGLGQPQADIDVKQAEAVSGLIKALEGIPNAATQVGSILLVKIASETGPVVQVRTLTQIELIHLENNQRLLSSPENVLERLSEICQNSDELKSSRGQKRRTKKEIPSKDLRVIARDSGVGI